MATTVKNLEAERWNRLLETLMTEIERLDAVTRRLDAASERIVESWVEPAQRQYLRLVNVDDDA